MRILIFIAALGVCGLNIFAQPLRKPDPASPRQAYEQLLTVKRFAFGGVGYAGVTSQGEIAYRVIAGSTNALALFSATFTNGNAQAKLYALCGVRQFAPGTFDAHARSLIVANPQVETMCGCVIHHEFATNVIARISSGFYEVYFKRHK